MWVVVCKQQIHSMCARTTHCLACANVVYDEGCNGQHLKGIRIIAFILINWILLVIYASLKGVFVLHKAPTTIHDVNRIN